MDFFFCLSYFVNLEKVDQEEDEEGEGEAHEGIIFVNSGSHLAITCV